MEHTPTTAPPRSLRGRVLGGLAWTGGSEVVMQVVRIVAAVALARLLAPEAYGLAAIALIFSSLVLVFSDLAFGAAIVQRKNLTELDRCSAFWISVGAGLLFTVVGIALAGPVARFYDQPDVAPLCAVLSLSFLITSLATTHEALLLRAMQYAKLERRMMVATLAAAAVGILVGVMTHAAWAIIAQQLTQATVSCALLWWYSDWRPGFRVSRESLRHLWGFSGPLVGHRLLFYVHRNADNILIGRYVGVAALGAYSLAYNIMLAPMSRIAGPVQRVLGPVLARMQDEPERIAIAWIRVVRLLAMIAVPALAGLVVVAPDFVHVVLGDRWSEAIPLIQILAWVGLLQALQSINADILQARGNTGTILRYSIVFTTIHIAGFIVGLHWGVIGVAVAYAITTTCIEPWFTWLTARSIGISPWRLVRGLRGVFEAGLIMAGGVLAMRALLVHLGIATEARFGGVVLFGVVLFGLASWWRAPDAWADLRGILADVRARRTGVPEAASPATA